MNILIVDDEEAVLAALGMVIHHLGMMSVHAACGEEALALVEVHTFDLILLDMSMPRMSGLEVLRCLRQNERTREVPVIFLTGQQEPELKAEALALGAVDYLSKPFDLAALSGSIRLALPISSFYGDLTAQTQTEKLCPA